MSSQVKVIRTVSSVKRAITLLWPYQPVCILLFDYFDNLVFRKDNFIRLRQTQRIPFKTGCCSHIVLLYFRKVLTANWRLTLLHLPVSIFTCIWLLASVIFILSSSNKTIFTVYNLLKLNPERVSLGARQGLSWKLIGWTLLTPKT